MQPVLDDLAFGNALEEQPRARTGGINAGERRTLMLRGQRAIEIVPASKPLRWRRYDVPQHVAPETGHALRIRAIEGDLELPDRRHQSTLDAGVVRRLRGPPRPGCPGWHAWLVWPVACGAGRGPG